MAALDQIAFSVAPGYLSDGYRWIADLLSTGKSATLLEVGCGTGQQWADLAARFPRCHFVGVDFSAPNIAQAQAFRGIDWQFADYLSFDGGRFDVICCESVLYLMECSDDQLAAKLAADLNPDAFLVVTMPVDSLWNRSLAAVRRLMRAIKCEAIDACLLWILRRAYPAWPETALAERLAYLYIVPNRLDGAHFRATMARHGLYVIEDRMMRSTSLWKLMHRLVIFKRQR